jgi:hypothetical protein
MLNRLIIIYAEEITNVLSKYFVSFDCFHKFIALYYYIGSVLNVFRDYTI